MNPSRSTTQASAQFLNRTQTDRVPLRRLLGLAAALSGAACLAILLQQEAGALIMALFALFAAVGVAALFASAAGFLHFGMRVGPASPDLSPLYAENASHGIALTARTAPSSMPIRCIGS